MESGVMPRRSVVAAPNFGRRLKALREREGLSLRRLGQKIHCSHGYLWDLEAGTKRPSVSVAVLLDAALNACGELSALVYEVSADGEAPPVGAQPSASSLSAGLEFAPDWRHGLDAAVELWQGDMQRRDVLRGVGFSAAAFLAEGLVVEFRRAEEGVQGAPTARTWDSQSGAGQ